MMEGNTVLGALTKQVDAFAALLLEGNFFFSVSYSSLTATIQWFLSYFFFIIFRQVFFLFQHSARV